MKRKLLAVAAAAGAMLVAPAPASADNNAVGSLGTVQVGATSVAPAATAAVEEATAAAVAAPVEIAGEGGNTATSSIGTVQVGGGNAVDESAVTVQVTSVASRPTIRARVGRRAVEAAVPAATGRGTNRASRSLVTVQIGGGGTAADGSEPVRVARREPLATGSPAASVSADDGIDAGPDVGASDVTPANEADRSIGVVQAGPVSVRPAVTADTPAGFYTLGVAGGIGGEGANSASRSIDVVQVGGGNSADDSAGVVQSGPVTVRLRTSADDTPIGAAWTAGGSFGVDDTGSNRASDSLGALQVGGGNTSSDSNGALQSGAVTADPDAATDGPADVTLDVPTTVGGPGDNTASSSTGIVQIGGGNTATGSTATAQVGEATSSPSAPTTPASGGDGTPTAAGPPAASPGLDEPAAPATPTVPAPRRPVRGATEGVEMRLPKAPHVAGRTPILLRGDRELRIVGRPAALPFTGLALWLVALIAAALVATGAGTRRAVAVR